MQTLVELNETNLTKMEQMAIAVQALTQAVEAKTSAILNDPDNALPLATEIKHALEDFKKGGQEQQQAQGSPAVMVGAKQGQQGQKPQVKIPEGKKPEGKKSEGKEEDEDNEDNEDENSESDGDGDEDDDEDN